MAGIFLDSRQSKTRANTSFVDAPAKTPLEVFTAAQQKVMSQDLFTSKEDNERSAFDDRIDQIENLTGRRLPNPLSGWIKEAHPPGVQNAPVSVQKEWFEQQLEEIRNALPPELRGMLETGEQMQKRIAASVQRKTEESDKAFDNTSGLGVAAGVAGELTAFLQDPLILATFPLGWPNIAERSTLQAMGRIAATEGVIAAGTEAIIQPTVQDYRKELGFRDAGFDAGLRNVILAAGAGTVLGGTLGGLVKTFPKLFEKFSNINTADSAELAKELRSKPDITKPEEVLAGQLEKDANLQADDPLLDKKTSVEHDTRTQAADEAAVQGELPTIPDQPETPVSAEAIVKGADNEGSTAQLLDPEQVNIDAKRFQFKETTEPEGVTKRLKDVEEWDPTKAGLALVWEDKTGKLFIADGHQRAALARRLLSKDPDADIKLLGIVRKETEGFTAEDVMVEATMKNIAEADVVTPQMAIDAAKVLRIRPDEVQALIRSLPPRSTMVKTVRGLTQISDEAFSAVINQKVSATHAAMLGRLVPDDTNLQDAIMRVLIQEKVIQKTDIEAESIIRQAREVGTRKEFQETLFGKEEIEVSLFSERARILKSAIKRLKQEKTVFRSLVKNKGEIEAKGNQLKSDVNLEIAQDSAIASELLLRLANRTGALSDALTEAAKVASQTKKFGPATDQFIDSVREAITRGDFEGATVSGTGRSIEAEAQARTDTAERTAIRDAEDLKEFDEPDGPGQEKQAELFDEDIQAREADPELSKQVVPVAFEDPVTGSTIPSTLTFKQIADEIKGDDDFLTGLAGCLRGK